MARPRLLIVREQLEDREVANWLPLRDRFDVRVVTTQAAGRYAATGLGLPVRRLPTRRQRLGPSARLTERGAGRWWDLDPVVGLDAALAGADVVVLNETHLASSAQAAQLRRAGGPALLVVCYENIPFRYEESARVLARKRLVRAHADRFVALTEGARQALVTEGVPADRVSLVTYGVSAATFDTGDRDGVRAGWGVGSDVVALYTGRLLQEKGVVPLVQAFALLDTEVRTHARLVLVGDGPDEPRLREVVATLGLGDRVTLLPWAAPEHLPHLLAAADLFVMPSLPTPYWEEQLGFSMVEAMAAGLPVLGCDGGCIPEVLGGTGVLVPPYDTRALADGLAMLLGNPELRQNRGAAARHRVASALTTSVAAAGLAAAVDRLVSA
jgi:glycosyltransferase involved in cell wall biosynthesis